MIKYSTKVFLSITLIMSFTLAAYSYWLMEELRDRYAETVEESLVDLSNVLASYLSAEIQDGQINTQSISKAFANFKSMTFRANIHGISKDKSPINLYVTDKEGIIVYDSRDSKNVGEDYSRWNDVYLTLRGQYGARATRSDPKDPLSSIFYVASPMQYEGGIVGVVSVIKPERSLARFVEKGQNKIIFIGILVLLAALLAAALLSYWLTRPIESLMSYAKKVALGNSVRPPKLFSVEFNNLGKAFDDMRISLEGKKSSEHFVQNLIHELKSPLTAIQSAAELLEDKEMPVDKKRKFTKNIILESQRAKNQLNDLLFLASLESSEGFEKDQLINLNNLVAEIKNSFEPLLEKKSVLIESRMDKDKIIFQGEKSLIQKAINNIILNAIEFSPVGSVIKIFGREDEKYIVLEVIDSGPGVPDYAKSKIFDKFYSLERPSTQRKSTGLGLCFTKEVLSIYGGTVVLMDTKQGAHFKLKIPIS